MNNIQTTGGILESFDIQNIINSICEVFKCHSGDIKDLHPLQKGISNSVMFFKLNNGKYIFRYPGAGTDKLVDRGRESIIQQQIEETGIDSTLIVMSARYGWRISRYVENIGFDYKNIDHVVKAILLLRKLHQIPIKIRWEFDLKSKFESTHINVPKEILLEKYKIFPDFFEIKERIDLLINLAKNDGINKCLTHSDCRDENFLINDNEIYLIDWEYGGYSDPGYDIGSYVCGGTHTEEDIYKILYIYFGRKPSKIEKRHFYAYIAITGFSYMNWTIFKEANGQVIGYLKPLWYQYAREYSKKALELYK